MSPTICNTAQELLIRFLLLHDTETPKPFQDPSGTPPKPFQHSCIISCSSFVLQEPSRTKPTEGLSPHEVLYRGLKCADLDLKTSLGNNRWPRMRKGPALTPLPSPSLYVILLFSQSYCHCIPFFSPSVSSFSSPASLCGASELFSLSL